jgi:uncharacterized membrane protein
MFPRINAHTALHILGVLLWIGLGALLRFIGLGDKPLWADEFSTMVFSLGNSYQTIPVSQVISPEVLLQPLHADPIGSIQAVLHRLLTESNHPPVYFVLNNLWMRLWTTPGDMVSAWTVRSLSALIGVAGIPAMFGLGWCLFRSWPIAHLSAVLMAVSPSSVYLAQEARHYTLPVLWGMVSIACFGLAMQRWQRRDRLPLSLCFLWIGVNALGLATHYFFALLLLAELLTLLGLWLMDYLLHRGAGQPVLSAEIPAKKIPGLNYARLGLVGLGTLATGLVWLPIIRQNYRPELTQWVFEPYRSGLGLLSPLRNTGVSVANVVAVLPVRAGDGAVLAIASVGMAVAVVAVVGLVGRGVWMQKRVKFQTLYPILGLAGVAVGLLCGMDLVLRTRLTHNPRYGFIYLVPVIVLMAVGLASWWESVRPFRERQGLWLQGRWAVAFVLILATVSSGLTVNNWGFQKLHRGDLVAQDIAARSSGSVWVAVAHHEHGDAGRLMAVALQSASPQRPSYRYFLDHQACVRGQSTTCDRPTPALQTAVQAAARPLDLWLVDFQKDVDLTAQRCTLDSQLGLKAVPGFNYQHYRCR